MRAVVLARGLGTRMREPDPDAPLSEAQRRAADAGSKMMVPVHGRPFLDYVLGALADAGIADVALVVAPDHDGIRAHYAAHPPARVSLSFVVQPEALGTANAVLAAEAWTAGASFLAMNADNLYPVAALRDLASLAEPGLTAFERDDLVRTSNIPAERIRAFALVELDDEGYLTAIVEKPGSDAIPHDQQIERKTVFVSMNCWRFDARIFEACRGVTRSVRGELELPEAVARATRHGVRFRAIPAAGPVLDLSRRADAADIERRLAGVDPRP
jgi:UDP-N-acetylglucosamine diphosphorylase / glucose-1-phosphate thymidylyltransferase / UDP-N-acetylgalactosamine diphosphorylase / glucosamine-1-phosphate N-acetyltransferase / galactosamine-1-phosphate N-acetyltransferase